VQHERRNALKSCVAKKAKKIHSFECSRDQRKQGMRRIDLNSCKGSTFGKMSSDHIHSLFLGESLDHKSSMSLAQREQHKGPASLEARPSWAPDTYESVCSSSEDVDCDENAVDGDSNFLGDMGHHNAHRKRDEDVDCLLIANLGLAFCRSYIGWLSHSRERRY